MGANKSGAKKLIVDFTEHLADFVLEVTDGAIDLSQSKAAKEPVWRYDNLVNGSNTRAVCGLLGEDFAPLRHPIESIQDDACAAPGRR